MSPDEHVAVVTLFVRAYDKGDPNPDLWAHVEGGKDRAIYQYRFEPRFGAVRVQVGQPKTVRLRLQADKDIALHDLRIETDPHHQLHVERGKSGPDEFVIRNTNDAVQVAYYSILVKAGKTVLACDPMIINRP